MQTGRRWAAVAVNALVVALEVVAVIHNLREGGVAILRYYTVESNIAAGLVSLLFVITAPVGRGRVPRLVARLRYYTACCLMVTFFVVVAVLAPMLHTLYSLLFTGSMLYQHLLCPLLSLFSFAVLERGERLSRRDIFLSLIPTALYAAVVVPLNAARVMRGPYPFLLVHEQPLPVSFLWAAVIFAIALILSACLYAVYTPRKKKV